MSDNFGDAPTSNEALNLFTGQYDPLEAGDIGNIDLYGQNIGSLYPDITANLSQLDLENLLSDTDLFNAFAKFDPESAALLKAGNLTSTGTSALTGEGLLADAAADKISSELGGDTTKLSNLTQSPSDVALVNPNDINKNVKVVDKTNPLKRLLSGEGTGSDLLSGLLAAYMAREAYKESQRSKSLGAVAGKNAPVTATRTAYKGTKYAAQGGLMGLAEGGKTKQPYYLGGSTDGMADKVPAHIDRKRPAALSDGEFVIPADVVSHLGNGNSNAGAKRLYEMMDRIRSARTGNSKQGKQINPDRFLPR